MSATFHVWTRPAAIALAFLLQAGRLLAASLSGVVLDAETREPVPFAQVQLIELERSAIAHDDGSFHFIRLPAGSFTLWVSRIGYRSVLRKVTLQTDQGPSQEFTLIPDHLLLREVTTSAKRSTITGNGTIEISGRQLQERLGQSVAETLAGTSGISVRSMGPAPARPVARGQNGARLTLLEDGSATGDLSASSSDHAVAMDPLLIKEIEVIRGPEAYLHSSSALGGVVNVKHDSPADVEPHRVSGTAIVQGSAAARSLGSGIALSVPLRKFVVRAGFTTRKAGDLCTPVGALRNTQSDLTSGSAGVSIVDKWGKIGLTFASFATEYGLPGGFFGAHPDGVSVELRRDVAKAEGAWHVRSNVVSDLSASYSFTRVLQREYEAGGSLGVEFGLLIDQAKLDARFKPLGRFQDLRVTAQLAARDYETAAFSFTPDSRQLDGSIAASTKLQLANWMVSGALRTDMASIVPDRPDTSRVIGVITQRNFSGISGALRLARDFSHDWSFGAQVSRSFRAPQIEELFSEGPHLAAYSYEIGNPRLPSESGWTIECDAAFHRASWLATASVYGGAYESFIYPQPTGRPSAVRNDLELYQYMQGEATIFGGEVSLDVRISEAREFKSQVAYVRGVLPGGANLPGMPPLKSDFEFMQQVGGWRLSPVVHAALKQSQVGEFEAPTAGYVRYDFRVSRHWTVRHALLVATAKIENLLDTPYRNHLSRVKAVFPEAGRNFDLTLSLQF